MQILSQEVRAERGWEQRDEEVINRMEVFSCERDHMGVLVMHLVESSIHQRGVHHLMEPMNGKVLTNHKEDKLQKDVQRRLRSFSREIKSRIPITYPEI